MGSHQFDPTEAVTFDLAFGHVHMDGAPTRVLVPADGLMALCEAAGPAAVGTFGAAIGEAMGRRVRVRLDMDHKDTEARQASVRGLDVPTVVEHLAGELALCGLGALGVERWGKALVLLVDQSPMADNDDAPDVGDTLLGAVLSAAVTESTGTQVDVIKLHRDGVRVRFLVGSPNVTQQARARLAGGEGWGTLLAALHARAGRGRA